MKATRDYVPGFGELIKRARVEKGWSGNELAKRAGVAQTAVSAIERGVHAPSLRAAVLLLSALEVDLDVEMLAESIRDGRPG